jgi:hypothetical protein
MCTNGRSLLRRLPAMALLVAMTLPQAALAQGQPESGGGAVTGATTEAARPAVASAARDAPGGQLVDPQRCYYRYGYYYCRPDGDHGRGRGDRGRGGHGRR